MGGGLHYMEGSTLPSSPDAACSVPMHELGELRERKIVSYRCGYSKVHNLSLSSILIPWLTPS